MDDEVGKKEFSGKETAASNKERDDRLRIVKERQNEERQKKLEELRAQALAAQKYREQKEEERRRRIEDLKHKDTDRRTAVEERKKAIQEAEKERREYLLRKNLEREARFETKRKNDRSSVVFAFGSSTPRLLDPGELGPVTSSNFWNHRRATSISNISYSGQPLTRRSSERELSDAPKKRATSAGGLDRQKDDTSQPTSHSHQEQQHQNHRQQDGQGNAAVISNVKRRALTALPSPTMSTSMYEVFNWGFANEAVAATTPYPLRTGKRMHFSIAGPSINVDEPPPNFQYTSFNSSHSLRSNDVTDSPQQAMTYRNVARRKTDLMPTMPSPRDGSHFGSRSSLTSASQTPRSPGRAVSMTRLDQLARPIRRNGEHISAIVERQRRLHLESLNGEQARATSSARKKSMSRSMSHLATGNNRNRVSGASSNQNVVKSSLVGPTMQHEQGKREKKGLSPSKSMCHLAGNHNSSSGEKSKGGFLKSTASKIMSKVGQHLKRGGQGGKSEEEEATSGMRSGEVTPGGTLTSRPNSALSTSTTTSVVSRRSTTTPRKPRPASIAVTGVSMLQNGGGGVDNSSISNSSPSSHNKLQKQERPPLPKQSSTNSVEKPKRPQSALLSGAGRDSLMTRSLDLSKRGTPPAKSTPKAAAVKTSTPLQSPVVESKPMPGQKLEKQKSSASEKSTKSVKKETEIKEIKPDPVVDDVKPIEVVEQEKKEIVKEVQQEVIAAVEEGIEKLSLDEKKPEIPQKETVVESAVKPMDVNTPFIEAEKVNAIPEQKVIKEIENLEKQQESLNETNGDLLEEEFKGDMSASMIAKSRINTEEEAKAALAERRRLAREEAERQAELERQRIEAEQEAETKRIMEEEERYRQMEMEANRMAEEQRLAEETRLAQAIEEAKKKEEEERLKKEEEARQKVEREEQEKKAREEAEKQRVEMAEKLKKEEKEREERRKRVEAIMSRTRAKGTPTKGADEKQDPSQKEEEAKDQSDSTNSNNIPKEENYNNNNENNFENNNGVENLNNNNTNNNNNSYEKSVTDKENSLLGSFDHIISDKIGLNNKVLAENVESTTTITTTTTTTAAVPENGLNNNNNKNGIDMSINSDEIATQLMVDENNAKNLSLTSTTTATTVVVSEEQLIDFGAESLTNNNNNNNNMMTTTTTGASQLVTDLPLF